MHPKLNIDFKQHSHGVCNVGVKTVVFITPHLVITDTKCNALLLHFVALSYYIFNALILHFVSVITICGVTVSGTL